MRRRWAYALVVAACVVPRLAALLYARGSILSSFVEKSDTLAQIYLKYGTFGYVPGQPSASTQPLYGWFLIVVYWIGGRHWWSLGTAQILVAAATALIVYETGRRFISPRAGLLAALISTLEPYLIWHDIHSNREILDQCVGAATFLLALQAGKRRSLPAAAALGFAAGVAILSNGRLTLLPLVLAGYLFWRHVGWAAAVLVPVAAAVALAPWVVRNKIEVGCWTITTDTRALWKANNIHTYATLKSGHWIDDVPIPSSFPVTPTLAGDIYASTGKTIVLHECVQEAYYQHLVIEFWKHHPTEKLKLMAQATGMIWTPQVTSEAGGPSQSGTVGLMRRVFEPAWVIVLYALALVGLFFVTLPVRVLALLFLAYQTFAAWIFAGNTRYRVPWDFVLALLAAAAIDRLWKPLRRPPSQ
jgi:4-amino-4-deoxy-L-arabinose transferase-like glycosyltransferase